MNKHSKSKIRDADRIRSFGRRDLTVLDLDPKGDLEMMLIQGIDPKQGREKNRLSENGYIVLSFFFH